MDWNAKIVDTYRPRDSVEPRARPAFRCGASEDAISQLEKSVGCRLPMRLRSLLLQTDGVTEEVEVAPNNWIEASIVIYSVDQMIDTNLSVRRAYSDRNVDRYLFFSTAGADGIQFGSIAASEAREDAEVFAWYSDETSDKRMANSLPTFLTNWCSGRSTV